MIELAHDTEIVCIDYPEFAIFISPGEKVTTSDDATKNLPVRKEPIPHPRYTTAEGGEWKDFPPDVDEAELRRRCFNPKNRDKYHQLAVNGHRWRTIFNVGGHFYIVAAVWFTDGEVYDSYFGDLRSNAIRTENPTP